MRVRPLAQVDAGSRAALARWAGALARTRTTSAEPELILRWRRRALALTGAELRRRRTERSAARRARLARVTRESWEA